ncbi:MAG: hypothetical protein QOC94_2103 [Actinoplanes sp.]|jgi:hypothetical protein|nr:hypothetical protein [Actinoplanes sp.]
MGYIVHLRLETGSSHLTRAIAVELIDRVHRDLPELDAVSTTVSEEGLQGERTFVLCGVRGRQGPMSADRWTSRRALPDAARSLGRYRPAHMIDRTPVARDQCTARTRRSWTSGPAADPPRRYEPVIVAAPSSRRAVAPDSDRGPAH